MISVIPADGIQDFFKIDEFVTCAEGHIWTLEGIQMLANVISDFGKA